MENTQSPSRLFLILSAALTLPFILLCGPFAGFVIGKYVMVQFLKWHASSILFCVGIGILASGLQTWQLIVKIKQIDSPQNKKKNP